MRSLKAASNQKSRESKSNFSKTQEEINIPLKPRKKEEKLKDESFAKSPSKLGSFCFVATANENELQGTQQALILS